MGTIGQCMRTRSNSAEMITRTIAITCATILVLAGKAWSAEPLRVGVLLSLSGVLEQEGKQVLGSIRHSHELRSIALGRPVELVIATAGSDPAQAACAMYRLIERDRVSAVIGDFMSSTTTAAARIAEQKRIPMIAPVGLVDCHHTDQGYFFAIGTCVREEAFAAADLCRRTFGSENALVVTDIAQELSIDLAEAFRRAFTGMGGRIVGSVRIRTGQGAFHDALSRIASTKADVIYAPVFGSECMLIAKQIRGLGLVVPIVSGPAVGLEAIMQAGSPEGLYAVSFKGPPAARTAMAPAYRANYRRQGYGNALATSGIASEAYFMLLDAVEKAGSAEPEAIRGALAELRSVNEKDRIAEALSAK
ncbi:MAG: ABC transporter substrate-binding protein [Desulfomonile tiedjei]|nr:ABC transporter substrate-binding protein [Desulfomonile tiedjei]